jgi:hypothetical protein
MDEVPMSTNHRRSSGKPVKASAPDVGEERETDSEPSTAPDNPDTDDSDDPEVPLEEALVADTPPAAPESDDVPDDPPPVDPDAEDDEAGSIVNGAEKIFGWLKSS